MHHMNGIDLSLTYKVADMLAIIETNYKNHMKEYETSLKEYHKDLVMHLKAKLAAAQDRKPVSHTVNLIRPENHEESYLQAISMLAKTNQTEIVLNGHLYSQLILDQWNWKEQFSNTTAFYLNKMGGAGAAQEPV